MKKFLLFIAAIFLIPVAVFAGWQVSSPESSIPREPFFQAGGLKHTRVVPASGYRTNQSGYQISQSGYRTNQFAHLGQPAAIYAVSISGSLKENLERIMNRYHWKVIWKAPFDYNFDGRVTGASLPNVIQKLMDPFPLQAVMYMSNRTVVVSSRSKTGAH